METILLQKLKKLTSETYKLKQHHFNNKLKKLLVECEELINKIENDAITKIIQDK